MPGKVVFHLKSLVECGAVAVTGMPYGLSLPVVGLVMLLLTESLSKTCKTYKAGTITL